jgi:oligopeptide/dipeptide ABC transporter ATP-binding protein
MGLTERTMTIEPTLEIVPSVSAARPILEMHDLTVKYRPYGLPQIDALRKVNLKISAGEILGLVGESGAGKTTLARTIMGAIPSPGFVESGEIRFDGTDLIRQPDRATELRGRAMSIIVANPRGELNPLVPIGEQLASLAGYHLRLSRKEAKERALEMLRAVKISDVSRRFRAYPHELSGGMAQRVVIGAALICSPQLVISDDATSGLDVTVQVQILELLKKLARERRTSMIYITRDIGVAANFCDRIAILYKGEIVEEAPTSLFFSGPSHPYSNLLLAAFSHHSALRKRWSRELDTQAELQQKQDACLFADRCVLRQQRCIEERPVLQATTSDRLVRCHFPVDRGSV